MKSSFLRSPLTVTPFPSSSFSTFSKKKNARCISVKALSEEEREQLRFKSELGDLFSKLKRGETKDAPKVYKDWFKKRGLSTEESSLEITGMRKGEFVKREFEKHYQKSSKSGKKTTVKFSVKRKITIKIKKRMKKMSGRKKNPLTKKKVEETAKVEKTEAGTEEEEATKVEKTEAGTEEEETAKVKKTMATPEEKTEAGTEEKTEAGTEEEEATKVEKTKAATEEEETAKVEATEAGTEEEETAKVEATVAAPGNMDKTEGEEGEDEAE